MGKQGKGKMAETTHAAAWRLMALLEDKLQLLGLQLQLLRFILGAGWGGAARRRHHSGRWSDSRPPGKDPPGR
jgi:hypothetical protein